MKKVKSLFGVLFLAGIILSGCNFEFSTANVSDIKTCTDFGSTLCNNSQAVFPTNAPAIYISCKLNNAPENTLVTFTWKYMEGAPLVIDEVTLNSGNEGMNLDLNSSLSRPNNGWPTGKYQVEIRIGSQDESPEIKQFEVQ